MTISKEIYQLSSWGLSNQMREIYKKIEKIISEWIQPILDKRIEDDGRWTQSAWKGGHHWELSQDRFTIPRLLTLVEDVTCIRILISNTKRFNTSELRNIIERDNNEVIIITRTNISFNEYCKSDHFSKEEMMDLYNRIKDESGSDNLGVWGRDAISDYAVHAAEKVPAEWLQGYLGENLPDKSVDAIHKISSEILSTLDLLEEKKAALNNAIESGESAENWFAKEAMNESGSNGSKARVAAEFFNGITTANNTYENADENELIDVDNEKWDDEEWNDYRLKDSLKEVAVEAGKAGMREIASEAFMKASEEGRRNSYNIRIVRIDSVSFSTLLSTVKNVINNISYVSISTVSMDNYFKDFHSDSTFFCTFLASSGDGLSTASVAMLAISCNLDNIAGVSLL